MKAIHGGKVKNDRVDAAKIAGLLRSGMFPMAYVYPRDMRQEEGAGDPGSEDRPGHLSGVAQAATIRRQAFPGVVNQEKSKG
jgi:hypothetical protein